ncbi:MAG: metal ABC transporter permease [Candidatus Buchananbacteria bacterium CG10_big_fil_rev_8_21_14_0_10_42_9]|uniref:Metal ABC transporter permease n=1 Tax=Candidatus Buchananbacteria bacterium CG10_big_fil_rev_8_21_14_0_10_42_9 TaxID=1974526 RepID=A0A2H0W2I2_9BACT|nr:MAG: metal ABC transporter permease [Candidatus Buchananbacteria bacterium CG10_big_fil_rev_8_21_14_0_10_42_9]
MAAKNTNTIMLEILQFPFMQRALISGTVLALLLAVLGVFVVIKKMSFYSEGIAHASLAGVAIGVLLSWNPLVTALIFTAGLATLMWFIQKKTTISADSSIGILFTSGMALGILLMSLQRGYQPELISFLFGNILSITNAELILIVVLSVVFLIFLVRQFKQLVIIAFNTELAEASGARVALYEWLFYVMAGVAVVLGIKVLGIVLVTALLVIPVAIGKIVADNLIWFVIASVIAAEVMVWLGLLVSYYADLPSGATIVLVGTVIFILSMFLKDNAIK